MMSLIKHHAPFQAAAGFGSITWREDSGRSGFDIDRGNSTADHADEISGFDEDSTGWKSFRCEDCGKTFSSKSRMLRHRLTHSDERMYACDDCGKSFSQLSHLGYSQSESLG